MTVAGVITRVAQSGPLFVVVCLLSAPLILLRLFGYLFFASTTSIWALVPAVTLCALLVVAGRMSSGRRIMAIAWMSVYVCSVLFHGWADITFRLGQGQSSFLDGLEVALVFILVARCLAPGERPPG